MAWKYNGKTVRVGSVFEDSAGNVYPDWFFLSTDEKIKLGMVYENDPPAPDAQILKISDSMDLKAAKAACVAMAKQIAAEKLSRTDWYVIRAAEGSEAIPESVQTERQAIRTASNSIEETVNSQKTVSALKGHLVSRVDANNNVTREALFDRFPEIVGECDETADFNLSVKRLANP